MNTDLHNTLNTAAENRSLPAVIAYNRIDGPGSSLDLKSFQQALWRLPDLSENVMNDPRMEWSKDLPRTVGITIDTGTRVEAHPYKANMIAIESIDYNKQVSGAPGKIAPVKENWLLKIIDLFSLSGVKFVLENFRSGTHSSGLGGSATATSGVCLLANELAGRPFDKSQLIATASCMEHDLGVSITGTQEQANVFYGGIVDYIWFPWGIPGREQSGFGASIQTTLLPPESYSECERRMTVFHTGKPRHSTDVNKVWTDAMKTVDGYTLHAQKTQIAYDFREGLRLKQWNRISGAIKRYRQIRTTLCPAYLDGSDTIVTQAEESGCEAFPLGAGGGGGVLVYGENPETLEILRNDLKKNDYREIPIKIRSRGHELINLPLK